MNTEHTNAVRASAARRHLQEKLLSSSSSTYTLLLEELRAGESCWMIRMSSVTECDRPLETQGETAA